MTISEYRMVKDFNAPKVNLASNEFQSYRMYRSGNIVSGYIDNSFKKPLLVVENMYVIPLSAMSFVKDIEIDGKPVIDLISDSPLKDKSENAPKLTQEQKIKSEAQKIVKSQKIEIPAEYKEQMDKIKNTSIVGSIVQKSRNSVNGMLIGAGVGLLAALVLKQSKFLGIIIGATGGGLIGYKINSEQKKKKQPTEVKK